MSKTFKQGSKIRALMKEKIEILLDVETKCFNTLLLEQCTALAYKANLLPGCL